MSNHVLVEIVEHRTSTEAASIIAEEAAAWLGLCCLAGSATVALPGGRSPAALLASLAAFPIAWNRITVTTTDERQVPINHALSNMGNVRRAFDGSCGGAASFIALDGSDAFRKVRLPFDLAILGLGADGHIASLFPGSPMGEAGFPALIELTPDPLPREAPVSRRSWSLPVLASARRVLVVCAGTAKREAYEAALETGTGPLGAFLGRARGPVTIHWAEA